jgi:hypothetical protein
MRVAPTTYDNELLAEAVGAPGCLLCPWRRERGAVILEGYSAAVFSWRLQS